MDETIDLRSPGSIKGAAEKVLTDTAAGMKLKRLQPPEPCGLYHGLFSVLPRTCWMDGLANWHDHELRTLARVRPGRVRVTLPRGFFALLAVARAGVHQPTWKYSSGPRRVPWSKPGAAADGVLICEVSIDDRRGQREIPISAGTRWLLIRQMNQDDNAAGAVVDQIAVAVAADGKEL